MRIVVVDDLPEGGAKRVVYEHVKGLSKNHTIDYITNTCKTIFPFDQYADSVTHFPLELKTFRGWLRPLQELSYYTQLSPNFNRITTLINQINPDIILVHPSRFTQAPVLLSMIQHKSVYFAHEWFRLVYEPDLHPLPSGIKGLYEHLRRSWLRKIDLQAVASASRVATTSRYNLHSCEHVYLRNFDMLPLGVSDVFLNTKPKPSRGYFLFIGEKEAINGYPLLQSALKISSRNIDIRYITFRGSDFKYTDSQLSTLYSEAIATLCLAPHEPFGLTAIESMACHTPVIALNEGGYQDTVIDSETGFLIKSNPQELLERMNILENDSHLRRSMGTKGHNLTSRLFSWPHHVLELEQLLTQVAYG